MKKIMNHPENLVAEMIEGIVLSFPSAYERINDQNALRYINRNEKKVSIVVGGGSGHEPMFFGFLGKGLADAVAIGNMFTAPNPLLVVETAKAVDNGAGILFLYGNHSGDLLNFGMATDLLRLDGVEVENIVVSDDIGSSDNMNKQERRGVAGIVFVIKILGAAAERGYSFLECLRIGKKVNQRLYSLGVGINPGINPLTGKPNFEIAEDKLEFGIGVHGEPGKNLIDLMSAEELSRLIVQNLGKNEAFKENAKIGILINGLGSFTLMEELLISRTILQETQKMGLSIVDVVIGNYFTTNDMNGFSVSILEMDDELIDLYHDDYSMPFQQIGGKK
ncbi:MULTISPECIES: dihydroxyacetone kinase subunit DhaK [Enterococcus]|uniref:Dihydroxyacetone kinase subunit DhaK n=1 Tax=Enterococcus alishanensis TaxID=1303817 RepID=A0ABS6TEI5_9ENTE|nr:dihydroxyacetone kinase subunit DhaK [Enterococcus alishanensis]MBV7391311.1 dihydroxyacetone kinase subunit DhaK [Enterococcus alishanensis]